MKTILTLLLVCLFANALAANDIRRKRSAGFMIVLIPSNTDSDYQTVITSTGEFFHIFCDDKFQGKFGNNLTVDVPYPVVYRNFKRRSGDWDWPVGMSFLCVEGQTVCLAVEK